MDSRSLFYIGKTYKSALKGFQEHVCEFKRVSILVSLSFEFKPLYAALAKEGFHSLRVFPLQNVHGDFRGSADRTYHKLLKLSSGKKMDKYFTFLLSKRLCCRRQVEQYKISQGS